MVSSERRPCRLLMEYANHAEMAEDPSTFVTAIAKESLPLSSTISPKLTRRRYHRRVGAQ